MSLKTWSDKHEQELIELYTIHEVRDIDYLANYFKKGQRSVVSKLVQLRIYVKPKKPSNRTVKILLRELEEMLDINIDGSNLSKKENLEKVVDGVKEKLQK